MATSTRSLTVPTKEAVNERRCPCGCAPCEGTCCHLDCIVRPRFFCGQLLTDADLSALLKWARDRFGLSRYRHGWGVVCGLDVRCDPKRSTAVVVTPGYAVNCCGDDIVVCEDAALDLSNACREETDPCADLRRRYEATVAPSKAAILKSDIEDGRLMGGGLVWSPGAAEKARLRVVDLYLRYDEKPSEPATALGRSSCKQVSECEYSRTRESYKLTWEFGVEGSDPVQARAVRWREGYEKCLDVLKEFRAQFPNGFPAADVRRWLLRWIDAHPTPNACILRDELCRKSESFFSNEQGLVALLFQLVQDCRNAYLNCDCFGCDEDTGVPLARVWLTTDEAGAREGCRIVAIDSYPPYRRPVKPECWPAPLGSVNVGRFIWHRWEEACTALDDLGLHVTKKEFKLPATLVDLQMGLQCNPFVECDEKRDALVYKTDFLGERVVGFCAPTDVPPPPPAPDMTLTKTVRPAEARPGQSVTYEFEVHNTGNIALQVRVEDASLTLVQDLGTIEPGHAQSFERQVTIPASASRSFSNTATATGTGGGQTITQNATANITILSPDCPTITVICPPTINVGEPLPFTASLTGGDLNAALTFNWTVTAGTIQSGQGTPAIVVDTTGMTNGSTVTATVEVGGLDPSCQRTKSGDTILRGVNGPRKVDEYGDLKEEGDGGIRFDNENARLDAFTTQLQNEPGTQGYIIVYGAFSGRIGEVHERITRAQAYLSNRRGVDAARIVMVDGGLRDRLMFELWLAPSGAAPPTPTPTLSAQLRDNLTELNQIGPARSAKLNEAGISTFAGLASTPVARLKELIPEVSEDVSREWIASAKSRTK